MSDTPIQPITAPKRPFAIGQVRRLPFHLSTTTLEVDCLVLDMRQVFGRTEWQISPVQGTGLAWIREDGPRVRGTTWQKRHDKPDPGDLADDGLAT